MRMSMVLSVLVLFCGLVRGADEPDDYIGPTEADIRAAYAHKLAGINRGTRRFLSEETAPKLIIELVRLDFIECDPIDKHQDHYRCSVLAETRLGDNRSDTERIELVLLKDGDVWKAL